MFSNTISVASNIVSRACFDLCSLETVIKELQVFTSSYLTLREIDKKKIQAFENPIEANGIRRTLRIIALSECQSEETTERYAGGRKEQAIENEKNGIASAEDKAILNGEACAWCGKSLQSVAFLRGVQSTYCSQECAEEGRLKRGGMYASTRLRAQLFSLEHGICQLCGLDANGRLYFYQLSSFREIICSVLTGFFYSENSTISTDKCTCTIRKTQRPFDCKMEAPQNFQSSTEFSSKS